MAAEQSQDEKTETPHLKHWILCTDELKTAPLGKS